MEGVCCSNDINFGVLQLELEIWSFFVCCIIHQADTAGVTIKISTIDPSLQIELSYSVEHFVGLQAL